MSVCDMPWTPSQLSVMLIFLLNTRRRDAIKPDLNPMYRPLCSKQVPITNLLFGDDLTKALRDIRDLNQVARRTGKPRQTYQHQRYGRPRFLKKRDFFSKRAQGPGPSLQGRNRQRRRRPDTTREQN